MQCNLSIVTQGGSGPYSTRTLPPRDGEQYFSVCLFFWMEEKLSQNVPSWLSLMAYWSGLCHMPRLRCQSLDKSSRMSRTVSDQWSSHQDHAVRLTEHRAAWAPPQTGSPCGPEFSLLVPYLVVLIPENSPHFGRSDNFSLWTWLCDTQDDTYNQSFAQKLFVRHLQWGRNCSDVWRWDFSQ